MAINTIRTTVRNSMCDAFVDDIDTGSTDTGGDLQIHTAAFAALLAEMEFSATAFGVAGASNPGEAIAAAVSDETSAPATGTAAVTRILGQDNATHSQGTAGGTGSGEDVEMNTTSVTTGDTVSVTSALITMPAG